MKEVIAGVHKKKNTRDKENGFLSMCLGMTMEKILQTEFEVIWSLHWLFSKPLAKEIILKNVY